MQHLMTAVFLVVFAILWWGLLIFDPWAWLSFNMGGLAALVLIAGRERATEKINEWIEKARKRINR